MKKNSTKIHPKSFADPYLKPEKAQQLFMASLGLVILAIILLAMAINIEHNGRISARASVAQTPFKAGQKISMGQANMEIDDISYSDGQTPFVSPAGKHYLMLNLTITNLSDKPIDVFPATDTYTKDDTGKITYLTPFVLNDPFRAGELSPGETIKGQLSFLVPKTGNIKFYVDAIWSGSVIPFSLN